MVRLSAIVAILLALTGCATGMKGSARRICYDAGYQPGTAEFTGCWHYVRDQQFAAEAPFMAAGLAAGIAAAPTESPAVIGNVSRQSTPTPRPMGLHVNSQCLYWTPQGQRVMQPVNGMCPRYGE